VVVGGAALWAADGWSRIRAAEAELEIVGSCARCAIVAVDPETGDREAAPLRALGRIGRRDGDVWLGQNARVVVPGAVRMGDPVEVL